MIKIENVEVCGWRAALRGMRNPKDSWHLADSTFRIDSDSMQIVCDMGPNDLKLAKQLHMGGPVHSKYKRYIIIYMDITAPLYWWKEYDTYKVGTTANSCSTMHKIEAYEFTRDMFSHEHLNEESLKLLDETIIHLNKMRTHYLNIKNDKSISDAVKKEVWWQLIQSLPTTFNQKRTVEFSYEVATNMYRWRYCHKQDEWRILSEFLISLPYGKDIILPPEFIKNEDLKR